MTIDIDRDGTAWLIREIDGGGGTEASYLGQAGDPATSYRVPTALLAVWAERVEEWSEAVEFGRACRDEVEFSFWAAKGAL